MAVNKFSKHSKMIQLTSTPYFEINYFTFVNFIVILSGITIIVVMLKVTARSGN
jgi:hypothetical protein